MADRDMSLRAIQQRAAGCVTYRNNDGQYKCGWLITHRHETVGELAHDRAELLRQIGDLYAAMIQHDADAIRRGGRGG